MSQFNSSRFNITIPIVSNPSVSVVDELSAKITHSVLISWPEKEGVSYNIYRDGKFIGTVSEGINYYIDEDFTMDNLIHTYRIESINPPESIYIIIDPDENISKPEYIFYKVKDKMKTPEGYDV